MDIFLPITRLTKWQKKKLDSYDLFRIFFTTLTEEHNFLEESEVTQKS
jgi:hypothetical protein